MITNFISVHVNFRNISQTNVFYSNTFCNGSTFPFRYTGHLPMELLKNSQYLWQSNNILYKQAPIHARLVHKVSVFVLSLFDKWGYFGDRLISKKCDLEWALHSLALNPPPPPSLDYYLWGHFKDKIYQSK